MNLLILPRYSRLGASSRLRFYQYIPYLEAHGVQTTIVPLLDDAYLRDIYAGRPKRPHRIASAYLRRLGSVLRRNRYNLIWLEYELFPWLPAWGERLLAHLKIPYIVEYDDAIFHKYDLNRWRVVRALMSKKIDAVMRRAALVVVGNDYLATHARRAGARQIAHIPTVIDLTHYTVAPSPDGPFSVGWIGMPPTAKYLDQIQDALVEVCRDGDVRITLVGVTPEHVNFGGFPLETRPWSEATEVIELQRFHAGIMPLLDEPWTRGKCGYKLVQYMACGLPVVASPVGANTQIVEPGVNGLLAKTPADWVHALRTLKSSPDLRARMGQAGRAKVEAEYCLQVTAPKLLALLGSAAQGKT